MRFKCVYAQYTPQEVFSIFPPNLNMKGVNFPLDTGEEISVKNICLRKKNLMCFMKSLICNACERKGAMFLLEQIDEEIHLRLYTDEYGLMTKDHIVPKSLGGGNSLDNLQTMCASCNRRKGVDVNWKIPTNEKVTAFG